jgi:hypothetical protein
LTTDSNQIRRIGMAVTITLHQKREAIPTGYRITSEVTAATNIPEELFLFAQTDDSYQHVCTVDDIDEYPDVSTPGVAYYRKDDVVIDYVFADLDVAIAEAALHKSRLEALATEFYDAVTNFVGEETVVYTS